jgi:hypothetical protein
MTFHLLKALMRAMAALSAAITEAFLRSWAGA